jgi:hypothetical protein
MRTNTMKFWLIAICVSIFPLSATAASYNPLAVGLGMTSCAQFIAKAHSPAVEDNYFEWAQGNMTGRNAMFGFTNTGPKDLMGIPFKDQKALIRDYCIKHPIAEYEVAVSAVFFSLPPIKRQQ